jgi:hypothetical protein
VPVAVSVVPEVVVEVVSVADEAVAVAPEVVSVAPEAVPLVVSVAVSVAPEVVVVEVVSVADEAVPVAVSVVPEVVPVADEAVSVAPEVVVEAVRSCAEALVARTAKRAPRATRSAASQRRLGGRPGERLNASDDTVPLGVCVIRAIHCAIRRYPPCDASYPPPILQTSLRSFWSEFPANCGFIPVNACLSPCNCRVFAIAISGAGGRFRGSHECSKRALAEPLGGCPRATCRDLRGRPRRRREAALPAARSAPASDGRLAPRRREQDHLVNAARPRGNGDALSASLPHRFAGLIVRFLKDRSLNCRSIHVDAVDAAASCSSRGRLHKAAAVPSLRTSARSSHWWRTSLRAGSKDWIAFATR